VLTASTAGITADIALSHYAVAKIGVRHLAAVAAHELGHLGIRVNAVAPGLTLTNMTSRVLDLPGFAEGTVAHTPLGRIGTVTDVADAVLALFALEWVTGQTLVADGGFSLLGTADVPGITPESLADLGL
jgi:NAD(P)-dependent dehydrogenase (short-subunit alcohol dehydrogenase family)